MTTNSTDPLGEMRSLVETLGMLQTFENLLLNTEQLQDCNVHVEERVRRLEGFRWQMKWLNTERLRILDLLRQRLFYHTSVEQQSAMAIRQGIVQVRDGLNGINQRMNAMSEDSNCPICLSPWTTQGRHSVVSLRCGHLFGRTCVRTAIRRSHRCPICRRRAQHSDVRRIFSQRIFS
ncbi:uncharacterized protein [Drosophila takahashii]|uniref:uncharacterized protein n=1 Tax=Drosophila takahashii TaxID=29030 RepID=UPI001CF90C79|nr:uncharacterized protein LOC108055566 [Drosophila takahashii]